VQTARGTTGAEPARAVRTVGAVSAAHFMSHVLQLVLAPLLPLLNRELGASFTELGLLFAVFYIASGGGQVLAGVLVDRFGPHRILLGGLALQGLSVAAMGFAPSYAALLPLAVAAGLGNSVYHPADLAILSQRVAAPRLGRAFSIHVIGGSAGFAASPVLVGGMAALWGWREALIGAGALALALWVWMALNRAALEVEKPDEKRLDERAPSVASAELLRIMLRPVVIFAFAYFALSAFAGAGIQNFAISALTEGYAAHLAVATLAVSLYQVGNIGGVVLGGYLADRTTRHHHVAMAGLAVAGLLVLTVAAIPMSMAAIIAILTAAGFAKGATLPSRDLLVRRAAPAGQLGRVFGVVYSGFDVGSLIAPLVYGPLLDIDAAHLVFVAVALPMFLGVATVRGFRSTAPAKPAPHSSISA
jgi:MFS transporter, FSR family, fosmidomycin resistance protein